MIVKVTLFGMLREQRAKETHGKIDLTLPEGSTLSDLLQVLEIDARFFCVHNGQHQRDPQTLLKDQDKISILPPVGGGRGAKRRSKQ